MINILKDKVLKRDLQSNTNFDVVILITKEKEKKDFIQWCYDQGVRYYLEEPEDFDTFFRKVYDSGNDNFNLYNAFAYEGIDGVTLSSSYSNVHDSINLSEFIKDCCCLSLNGILKNLDDLLIKKSDHVQIETAKNN